MVSFAVTAMSLNLIPRISWALAVVSVYLNAVVLPEPGVSLGAVTPGIPRELTVSTGL